MSFPFLPKSHQHGCGDPGAEINYSAIFDGSTTRLTRTPAVAATNATQKTWSVWVKPAANMAGGTQCLFDLISGATACAWVWNYSGSNRKLGVSDRVSTTEIFAAEFGDTFGEYHLHLVFDQSQTGLARWVLSVNGVPVASTGAAPVCVWGTTGIVHSLGSDYAGSGRFNGLLAEYIHVDGQALPPTAFGYLNRFGVWVPKKYAGTYGVQGFRLDFADPLNLGKDVSGNGNHWTATGLTAVNQVTDTPTHGFATLNPLQPIAAQVLSSGNLKNTISNSSGIARHSTLNVDAGRWYAEALCTGSGGGGSGNNFNTQAIGIQRTDKAGASFFTSGVVAVGGQKRVDGVNTAYGTVWQSPGVNYLLGILVDFPAQTVEFFIDGVSQGPISASLQGHSWAFIGGWESSTGSGSQIWNFGQRAFAHPENQGTAKTLSKPNLPCPAIKRPADYVGIRTRTASAGVADLWSANTIPTMVLSHRQDVATDWRINLSTRPGRAFAPNLATTDFADPDGLTFNASGYTVGGAPAYAGTRKDYLWRASRAAGFDIVMVNHVTGTPTTVAHAVGGPIDYAWVLPVGAGGNRRVYHSSAPAGWYFQLNGIGVYGTDAGWFASTAVDLTLGASMPSGLYAIPAWRSVRGLSAFGAYIGNGAVDGTDVVTGFAPCMVIARPPIRAAWFMEAGANPITSMQYMHETSVPYVNAAYATDFLSNGFKHRGADPSFNPSGETVYFAAWAEVPGKFARAR